MVRMRGDLTRLLLIDEILRKPAANWRTPLSAFRSPSTAVINKQLDAPSLSVHHQPLGQLIGGVEGVDTGNEGQEQGV